jgi:Flp pilus assembly protein TadD
LDSDHDVGAAQSAYEKTTAIQPNFPPGQRELGILLFRNKNYAAAAVHLKKAIALGLEDAHMHNFLGICYNQTNQIAEAVREQRRAIALDPKLAEAHLNLAYVYQRQNQLKAAQEEYASACKLDEKFCRFVPAR